MPRNRDFDEARERAWWQEQLVAASQPVADRARWRQVSLPRASARANQRRQRRRQRQPLRVGAAAAVLLLAAAAVLHAHQSARGPAAPVHPQAALADLSALVSQQVWKQHPGAQLIRVNTVLSSPAGPGSGVVPTAGSMGMWFEGEYRLHSLVWWEQVRVDFAPPKAPRLLGPLHPYAYPGEIVPPRPVAAIFFAPKSHATSSSSISIPSTDLTRLVALLNQAHPLPASSAECQGAHSTGVGPLTLVFSYRNQLQTGVYVAGSCAWFKPYAFAATGMTISSRHSRFVRFLFSANWYRMPAGIATIIRQAEQHP
ncbi:MAG: hypothetical protein M0Z54_16060 [Thermaerobacter sp.]|nr:hypothetical protein [Thermaerobacter sp.]